MGGRSTDSRPADLHLVKSATATRDPLCSTMTVEPSLASHTGPIPDVHGRLTHTRSKLSHMDGTVDAVTQHHVDEMVDALVAEFGDRFDREQIEELMRDSVNQLAGRAQVADFLPVLGYRFTRERLGSLSRASETLDIVFVSLSGGGRGQIAAALTTMLSDGTVSAHSAGTAEEGVIDPAVEQAITELGIDTSELFSRPVSGEVLSRADVVVTLGLSVGVVHTPEGVRREDWRVGDPVGASIEEARRVRDDIERRVRTLLTELNALPDEPAQNPRPARDEPESVEADSST
jgi:arsenate reductase (thioredoxin)